MHDAIPILSLITALLAVFFGPILSWRIARRQSEISLALANKQIASSVQQAWINSFRDLVAEFSSLAVHYYAAGYEERTDAEYHHMVLLRHRISLMLDLSDRYHCDFEGVIKKTLAALEGGEKCIPQFIAAHEQMTGLARTLVQIEVNALKQPITV
jgi:hypothetical protein